MKKLLVLLILGVLMCLVCSSAFAITEQEVMKNLNAPNDPNLQITVHKGFFASLMSLMSLISEKTRYGVGEIIALRYDGKAIDAKCSDAGVTVQIYKNGNLVAKNDANMGSVSANQRVVAGWKLPTSGDSRFMEGSYEAIGVIYCTVSRDQCVKDNCGVFTCDSDAVKLCELLKSGTHNWAVCEVSGCSGYGVDTVDFTIAGAPECIDGYGTKCQDNVCGVGYRRCENGRWLPGCWDKNTGELISNLLSEVNYCSDNKDNDCDGLIDCDDNDCSGVEDCEPVTVDRCADSTPKDTCSTVKPLYCTSEQQLVNDCLTCDCPIGQTCNSDTKKCEIPVECKVSGIYENVGCGKFGCRLQMAQRATTTPAGCKPDNVPTCPDGTWPCKCVDNERCEECTSDWSCESWSECVDGLQTRICEDLNKCPDETDKPATKQKCGSAKCIDKDKEECQMDAGCHWKSGFLYGGDCVPICQQEVKEESFLSSFLGALTPVSCDKDEILVPEGMDDVNDCWREASCRSAVCKDYTPDNNKDVKDCIDNGCLPESRTKCIDCGNKIVTCFDYDAEKDYGKYLCNRDPCESNVDGCVYVALVSEEEYCLKQKAQKSVISLDLPKKTSTELMDSICVVSEQCKMIEGNDNSPNCVKFNAIEKTYGIDVTWTSNDFVDKLRESYGDVTGIEDSFGLCIVKGEGEFDWCDLPLGCRLVGGYNVPILVFILAGLILLYALFGKQEY